MPLTSISGGDCIMRRELPTQTLSDFKSDKIVAICMVIQWQSSWIEVNHGGAFPRWASMGIVGSLRRV